MKLRYIVILNFTGFGESQQPVGGNMVVFGKDYQICMADVFVIVAFIAAQSG